ncbi:serine/threonine-protein kinase [Streptomyces sp. CB03238]|uniref:serine/threonine-protein kinase n=1 Tax=Streptomyces sp. CB03238 TaxID=1907777 RepID=UPI000A0FB83D|nr:serine/threonine-protein kinase [Streptomyces sp. CB03238]ORT60530.1 hypothetical protein BKD26_09210 [Streptomyces sp. CB03238]
MQPHEVVDSRYRLIRRLGSGGFGTVWEARDTRMQRPVALKVADQEGSPEHAERFLGEALTAGGLNHPHIVTVHDYGVAESGGRQRLYLVMELVDGEPLDAVLRRGLPPLSQALTWVEHICAALAAAHDRGVVHRDVKPANVLVQADGRAKLVDFGIAKSPAQERTRTDPRIVIGTLAYTAPERFAGITADPRSDLYAVGCLLAELCTGRPPFPGSSLGAMRQQHTQTPPAPLRSLRPDLPAELDDLVLQLLSKNPGERPQRADEVRDLLRTLAAAGHSHPVRVWGKVPTGEPPVAAGAPTVPPPPAGQPAAPYPPTPQDTGPRTARPRRRRALVGAVAAATVLLAGAGSWLAVDLLPRGKRVTAGPSASASASPSTGTPTPTPSESRDRERPSTSASPSRQRPGDGEERPEPEGSSAAPANRPSKSTPAPDTGRPKPDAPSSGEAAGALVSSGQTAGYDACPYGRTCIFEGWDGTGWMGYAPSCGTIDLGGLKFMVSSVRTWGNPVSLLDQDGRQLAHVNSWTSTNLSPEQNDRAVTAFVHCP